MHKLPLLIIILIGISFTPLSFSEDIPEWVKNNASWWSERQISQSEFTNGLEFLINEGIIYIPATEPGITGPDKSIPDWVRNTAGWWSDDLIPDSEFVNAMKYLIEIGLIEVDASSPELTSEEIPTVVSDDVTVPFHMLFQGYNHVPNNEKFILDVKIFDAEKYSGTKFGGNIDYVIDGVKIELILINEENEIIHTFNGTTVKGIVRYEVLPSETSLSDGLWLLNNEYTVKVTASNFEQFIEKNYYFVAKHPTSGM